jgi:hypothetical protein
MAAALYANRPDSKMENAAELSTTQRLAIHELISLYGHLIDQRQFSQLDKIFTDDAVFDLSAYDGSRYNGLPAIQTMMLESAEHPLAHHATNVVVQLEADIVSVISKGIGVGTGGRVGSVTYRDRLALTPKGWRIQERCCELRHTGTIPDPS